MAVTLAPPTTALDGSVMRPAREALVDWAKRVEANARQTTTMVSNRRMEWSRTLSSKSLVGSTPDGAIFGYLEWGMENRTRRCSFGEALQIEDCRLQI